MKKLIFISIFSFFLLTFFASCHKKTINCELRPFTPKVVNVQSQSLTITWTPLSDTKIYTIDYELFDFITKTYKLYSKEVEILDGNYVYTLTGLNVGSVYRISIAAKQPENSSCKGSFTQFSDYVTAATENNCTDLPSIDAQVDSVDAILGYRIRVISSDSLSQYEVLMSSASNQIIASNLTSLIDSSAYFWVKNADCYSFLARKIGETCLSKTAVVCCGPVVVVGDADRVKMEENCNQAPTICSPCQPWQSISYQQTLVANQEGIISLQYYTPFCPNYNNYVFNFQPVSIGCESSPLNPNQRIEYTSKNPIRYITPPNKLFVNRSITKLCPGREYLIKGIPFCSSLH